MISACVFMSFAVSRWCAVLTSHIIPMASQVASHDVAVAGARYHPGSASGSAGGAGDSAGAGGEVGGEGDGGGEGGGGEGGGEGGGGEGGGEGGDGHGSLHTSRLLAAEEKVHVVLVVGG